MCHDKNVEFVIIQAFKSRSNQHIVCLMGSGRWHTFSIAVLVM